MLGKEKALALLLLVANTNGYYYCDWDYVDINDDACYIMSHCY
jgi:hypothetical protein